MNHWGCFKCLIHILPGLRWRRRRASTGASKTLSAAARFHGLRCCQSLAQTRPLSFLIKEENEFSTRLEVTLTSASSGSWRNSCCHLSWTTHVHSYRATIIASAHCYSLQVKMKHIQLFKRFKQEFEDGFAGAEVIGPPEGLPQRYWPTIRWAWRLPRCTSSGGAASLSR